MIHLQQIEIGYHSQGFDNPILPAFSATAGASTLVAVLGRNGQGKTTLLRSMIGLQPLLAGTILMQGVNMDTYSIKQRARLLSYVSTDTVKVGNLKVFDLVSLGRYPYTSWLGILSSQDKRIIMKALEMVGMAGYIWKNTNALSDGERQRVMIARALAQDTPIIILDEPTAFLDLPNRYEIILLLQTLAKEQGKTIVYSTHDLNLALKTSDHLWVMANQKVEEGGPKQLLAQGVFDRMFKDSKINIDHITGDVTFKKLEDDIKY